MDNRLALMTGTDIPIPECQLIIKQPRIKDISFLGETDFFIGVQTLSINKSMVVVEDKSVLDQINNFQVFMTVINEKEMQDKRKKVEAVFQLFGLGKPSYTPQSLILTDNNNETHLIDANNFDYLQDAIKLVTCAQNGPMDQQAFNPSDKKAREIAQKLMRGRQRIAEERAGNNNSVFSQYLSILSVGIHQSLLELMKLTMFQLYDLVERFSLYLSWDIDIKSRLAGAKPDKEMDNWMKNIHN